MSYLAKRILEVIYLENLCNLLIVSEKEYSGIKSFTLPRNLDENYRFILVLIGNTSTPELNESRLIPFSKRKYLHVVFYNAGVGSPERIVFSFPSNNTLNITSYIYDNVPNINIIGIYQIY